jgi:hypothetical protein
MQCRGCVPAFLLTYNTAMNCRNSCSCPSPYRSLRERYDPIDLPISSQQKLSELLRLATSHHVLKCEEYGYQWRDIHNAEKFPLTPGCR